MDLKCQASRCVDTLKIFLVEGIMLLVYTCISSWMIIYLTCNGMIGLNDYFFEFWLIDQCCCFCFFKMFANWMPVGLEKNHCWCLNFWKKKLPDCLKYQTFWKKNCFYYDFWTILINPSRKKIQNGAICFFYGELAYWTQLSN